MEANNSRNGIANEKDMDHEMATRVIHVFFRDCRRGPRYLPIPCWGLFQVILITTVMVRRIWEHKISGSVASRCVPFSVVGHGALIPKCKRV